MNGDQYQHEWLLFMLHEWNFYGTGCQVPSTLSQRRSQSPHQASDAVNGHPEWLGEWRRQVSETYQRHEWHVMPSGKSMNGISG
jgi:hypothetical protein